MTLEDRGPAPPRRPDRTGELARGGDEAGRLTAAEIDRLTPLDRNRFADFLRLGSTVVVVLGHWLVVPAVPWQGLALAAGGLAVLAALVFVADDTLSMVGVDGAERSNNTPPNIALIALGLAQVGIVAAPPSGGWPGPQCRPRSPSAAASP